MAKGSARRGPVQHESDKPEPVLAPVRSRSGPVDSQVVFRGFFCVVPGLYVVAVCKMGVVARLLVVAFFVVLCGSLVVIRGMLVVFRCAAMMFGAFFRRGDPLLRNSGSGCSQALRV